MGYLRHRLLNFLAVARSQGPRAGAWKALRYGWRAASLPLCCAALRGRADPADAQALLFSWRGAAMRPLQHPRELAALLARVAALRPRVVLELGTANGGTLELLARAAAPDALLVSVDLPGGPFGGGYPAWRAPFYRAAAGAGQRVALLRRDSHDPRTLQEVRRLLAGRPVDLLFVDADHTYEGARADLLAYGALVRPGGLIALHDIATPARGGASGRTPPCGVERLWAQVAARVRHEELVAARGPDAMGIGLFERPAGPWPAAALGGDAA